MTTPGPVARNAEDVLFAAAGSALGRLLRAVTAEPHRLSVEALEERLATLQGRPEDEIRAELQAIANELELYRLGRDEAYEAGHRAGYREAVSDALTNPDEFADRLEEIVASRTRWVDDGSGPGHVEVQP